jgi:hypothetical protein
VTKQELEEKRLHIEPYAGGFMIADYRPYTNENQLAYFYGRSLDPRRQPIINDPFPTEEAAITGATTLAEQ